MPTKFYLEMYDHPKEMRQLCEDMEPYFDQIFRVLADSPAEVIFSGANYDEMITYPPFFRDHIMPHLQKLADLLHPKGKLLLCHCDGENKGLLDLIRESGMDIAEAICPQPMTKVTISGGEESLPGKGHDLRGSPVRGAAGRTACPIEEFEKFMKNLFPGDRPGGSIHPWRQRHHAAGCQVRKASADYRDGPGMGQTADGNLNKGKATGMSE